MFIDIIIHKFVCRMLIVCDFLNIRCAVFLYHSIHLHWHQSLSVPLSVSSWPSCSLQSWSSALAIPARRKPLTTSWGLSEKYSAIWTSHFAPSSFSMGSPRLIGSMSGESPSFPSSCDITWCAYHSSKCLFKKSFAGLFIDKSIGWSKSVVFGSKRHT